MSLSLGWMAKAQVVVELKYSPTPCAQDCGMYTTLNNVCLCRPIRQRERQLTDTGPTWRTPSVAGVLRNLPFMRHAPPQALEVTLGPSQPGFVNGQGLVC